MQILVSRDDPTEVEVDGLIVPMTTTEEVPRSLRALDDALDGQLTRYLETGDFTGKAGQMARFPAIDLGAERVVLVGLGDDTKADMEAVRAATGRAIKSLVRSKSKRVAMIAPALRKVRGEDLGQAIAEGAVLGNYRFEGYKSANDKPVELKKFSLLADGKQVAALRKGLKTGETLGESSNLARDLSNEPGGVATPEYLAKQAKAVGRETGLKVTVLAQKELERAKMGGLLAVGRGSANPPRMIIMEHGAPARGARKRPLVALVGKGITFDTGGISIKPAAAMDEMKHDMSGGATVIGAMRAIALLKLPIHVLGVVAAAQNMPDGDAYLPGDIVTASNGKTIEVLNTDAEGRVVLADALHYAAQRDPDAIVDLATLTGACLVALGSACCAVMGNDEGLIDKLREAGDRTHERAWPLPLWDEHKKAIEGQVGDIKNTGGRHAGTSTAGAFLSHFVGESPWAHLDIAGTEWTNQEMPYYVRGATGFGVRMLLDMLRRWK